MGVADFMEGSLKSYKIRDLGPLFHMKMGTWGPHFLLDTGAYLSTYVNTVKEGGKPIATP